MVSKDRLNSQRNLSKYFVTLMYLSEKWEKERLTSSEQNFLVRVVEEANNVHAQVFSNLN